MKNSTLFTLFTVIMLTLNSCNTTPSITEDNMAFENVEYIDKFPSVISVKDGVQLDLEVYGILGMVIQNNLMIISTQSSTGAWSFFDLTNLEMKGQYLNKGNGPNEFIQMPWGSSGFYKNPKGELNCRIQDFQKGKVYEMNIDNTLEDGKLSMSLTNESIPPYLSDYLFINDTTFFLRKRSADRRARNRAISISDKEEVPEHLKILNRSSVSPEGDSNIIGAACDYNPLNNIIIEAAILLNNINIYTPDGSFHKTICIGDKVDKISSVDATPRDQQINTFEGVVTYDDFFTVLYSGSDSMEQQTGESKNSTIFVFNYKGEPLHEIKLDRAITGYGFDLINKYFYTSNYRSDEIFRYKLPENLFD